MRATKPKIPLWVLRADHAEYLQSSTWWTIRTAAMKRAGGKCQRCGRKATQVHHRTYARTGGAELPSDLEALCRPCHMKHHNVKRRGQKKKQKTRSAQQVAERQARRALKKAARLRR